MLREGYEPFGQTAFGRRLAAKGFASGRAYVEGRLRRCWFGIRLRSDTDLQPDLPLSPSDNPSSPNMTDVTDVTRFSKNCSINSRSDKSFEKTRHNLSSVMSPPDSESGKRYIATEQWLCELEDLPDQPTEPETLPQPAERLSDNLACLCGSRLRSIGRTYKCSRCDNPLIATCRKCGTALQVTSDGQAKCLQCGVGYSFDRSRRLWLSDEDAF